MKVSFLIGLCFFSLLVKAQVNYYVSPTGINTIANGTLVAPWLTIQYGLDHLSNGDTLNVMDGTYAEKINIPISGITLRSYTGAYPVVNAIGLTSQTAIIQISSKSNVLVKGLELKNSIMLDAQGVLINGTSQNVTISNCIIHDIHFSSNASDAVNATTNAQGIIVYGSNATTSISNLKILNNELYNCRLGYSEGIAVNGNVDGFEVSGNNVHDLTNIGIVLIGHEGISSNAATDQARNGIVKHNIVHDCISAYATSGGLYVDGGKSISIENNTSYHNGYGIEIGCENIGQIADAITVRNNVCYNNQICAIALGGFAYPSGSGKVTNSIIRNNTCYANDYSHSGNGELYLSYSEGTLIENNIFHTSADNKLAYAELTQPALQFNYNVFYCSAGASSFSVVWNGNNYGNYTAFVSGTSSNANSLFANPLFTSTVLASPDFHLMASSPAINKGNPSFTTTSEKDLDDQPRTNGIVDCGVDEYYVLLGNKSSTAVSSNIMIYPNPSHDALNIQYKDVVLTKVTVYDLSGRLMESLSSLEKENVSLDVSSYAPGLYQLILLDDSGHQWIQKILID